MLTVLHYTGYRSEGGGILSVIRALHSTGRFRVVHGVSPGYVSAAPSEMELWDGPAIAAERINLREIGRARSVARAVRAWLEAGPERFFHGHTRAGLLVGLWLQRWGERRIAVSVHCYGQRRWFYRWAARKLGSRIFWLTPAMQRYYGVAGPDWTQCIPGGVPEDAFTVVAAAPEPRRLRVGAAGMFVRWKRWELVLEAMALLPPESRAQVSFEHIGAALPDSDSKKYADELRRLTARLGLADRVFWRGQEVSSRRLLSSSDLLVVPSHDEPYSMVIQEAWAAGVPVLAADSGGPREMIRPGLNGWLFRDGEARVLADLLDLRIRSRDWAQLDQARIRKSARRATDVAAQWELNYREAFAPRFAPR